MRPLAQLQASLRRMHWDGFWFSTADEFLSEFPQPSARRLRWLSGFSGSTGFAAVLQDRAAIFLDGRYQEQGRVETDGLPIEVHGADEASRIGWLRTHLTRGQRLAIDTRTISQTDFGRLQALLDSRGIQIVAADENPVDALWADRPAELESPIIDYSLRFAGRSHAEKCAELARRLVEIQADACLLTDPEDIAWLLNVRTHDSLLSGPEDWHIVPIPLTRALIDSSGTVQWFVAGHRLEPSLVARLGNGVALGEPAHFERVLAERSRGKVIAANCSRTPRRFAAIVESAGTLMDDASVTHARWRKHPEEIQRAREGHFQDGLAVVRFLAWLTRAVNEQPITEMDAARKLFDFRRELPDCKGMSMPLMSASGPNGALPHYVPSARSNRRLNDHPIYWMDSGAQFYGCSTDNTVCIAIGNPEERHIRAHTRVVKAYIALATARFPEGTISSHLDTIARQHLWIDAMDYGHGTGHGVGNFMNIHEGPLLTRLPNHPWVVPMHAGMIVSNEPAYYAEGDFGIRIESHLATVPSREKGFLEFETLSRLPIDPRLVDAALLTIEEKSWLEQHHSRIVLGYRGMLDPQTGQWLKDIHAAYQTLTGIRK